MERLKIFGLLFILLGLLATLTLVRQAQEFRNRAIGEGTLTFIDGAGNQLPGNPPTAPSQNVGAKLMFGAGIVGPTVTPTSPPGATPTNAQTTDCQVDNCIFGTVFGVDPPVGGNVQIVRFANTPVTLSGSGTVLTAMTDAQGVYIFPSITPATYTIAVGPQTGYTFSSGTIDQFNPAQNLYNIRVGTFTQPSAAVTTPPKTLVNFAFTNNSLLLPTSTPVPSPTLAVCNVTASVSPTTTTRGSTVTFTASGFSPNTAVTLTVTGPSSTAPATVTSDSNGQVVATLQIDLTDQQGVYTITATSTCGGSSVSASATLQVT